MNIPYNFIAILPDENFTNFDNTKILTANDLDSAGQRLSVRGKVIAVPQRLKYNGEQIAKERSKFVNDRSSISIISELKEQSMLFDVAMEVNIGDTVFFSYLEHFEAYQQGRFIEQEDGKDILLMRYDNLICAHKLNNVNSLKPLNGLILIEPFQLPKEESEIESVTLEKEKARIGKLGIARVLLTGKKCYGYLEDATAPKDTDEVKVNQQVLFKPLGAHLLEWHTHKVLFKGRKVMAIHRKNIIMIN